MFLHYLLVGFTAFLLTFLLTFLAIKFFPKWGLTDRPDKYGLKRKPIPYYGGLILFVSFIICALVFLDFNSFLVGLIIGATLLIIVNFLDDLYGLSPWLRLFVQILTAVIVILSGLGVETIRNPFGGVISLHQHRFQFFLFDHFFEITLIADLIILFWIVFVVNTMNWLDGLNGLPSGISFIGFLVLFFLSIRPDFHIVDQSQIAVLCLILAMICFAFWFFDFHPAKILMGDTGSMFLGFMLACAAIFAGGKLATTFLILGFPILDVAWVIMRRFLRGKSLMKGDLFHFHHRLIKAGFSHRQALLVYYLICALFGGVALFLGSWQKLVAILMMVVLMFVFGTWVVTRGKEDL